MNVAACAEIEREPTASVTTNIKDFESLIVVTSVVLFLTQEHTALPVKRRDVFCVDTRSSFMVEAINLNFLASPKIVQMAHIGCFYYIYNSYNVIILFTNQINGLPQALL